MKQSMLKNWIVHLRLIFGVGHILLPLGYGLFASNLWIIFPISVLFVINYIGGKWKQWNNHISSSSIFRLCFDVFLTWIVQLVVVCLFFFLGLGIGRLFGGVEVSEHITTSDIWILSGFAIVSFLSLLFIIFGESRSEEIIDGVSKVESSDDLLISDENVTLENFFSSRHFSVADHTHWALMRWPQEDGKKIVRSPVSATEVMIEETERRLGYELPKTLRDLYKIRDGGSLKTYWVPGIENPGKKYDDWIEAFSHGYNDLKPLKDLYRLISDYEDYFDSEYDDEDVKESWFPGSEKLVVLSRMYGVATLLDYRENEREPGVLLVDLDNPIESQIRKRYDNFDMFFADLRVEVDKSLKKNSNRDAEMLASEGYDHEHPHLFWANSRANSTKGVGEGEWLAQENRLGFRLPDVFKKLYFELDGGVSAYPFHPSLGLNEDGELKSPFPGELYTNKTLLPLSSWITLQELSGRLDFQGERSYRELYEGAGRLIVIAASYDQALLLDYRDVQDVQVLFVPDLMVPEMIIQLNSPEHFLDSLRQKKQVNALNPFDTVALTDQRLSPRVSHRESFWIKDTDRHGVLDDALDAAKERFGKAIPDEVATLMKKQNGGRVRFRYAPSIGNRQDQIGRPMNDASVKDWLDMFPGGVRPIEKWMKFSDFRATYNIALDQDFCEHLMPEMYTEPDVTERLIVIGSDDMKALTLLDLSESYFKSTPFLSRADYNTEKDEYQLVIAPITITHYTSGVFALLRARRDEL